jgi:hypothetical protein
MTCPKCSGALAMLFTSTYCPKCEAKEPAQSVAYDHPRLPEHRLYVGEDGELWWRHNDISWRITTGWVEVAPPGTCIKRTNPPGVGEDE